MSIALGSSHKKDICIIYLADLIHNYASRGPHVFPVNIGYIASYAKKLYGDRVRIRLFKFPLDLIRAIKNKQPHIIGLSNYTWNLDVNNKIISWIKSLSEDLITVFGGPDYPIFPTECLRYFKERPALDFYVINQGERGFANIVERYFQSSSIKQMKDSPVENCSFYDKNRDKIIVSEYRSLDGLEEIPSPYLQGLMDEFFGYNLIPLIETNRGCPYSCTYCAWGKGTDKKVIQFSMERIEKEIRYIAEREKRVNLLMVADANFGIFERDIKIARFIKSAKSKYGYPRNLFVAWAKSVNKRTIKMAKMLSDMGIGAAFGSFQSMDHKVLANIKRTNVPIQEFKKIQDFFRAKGISTSSELILGLPGETKKSHLKALRQLFECNTSMIVCYNLRMLGGSELNTDINRQRFSINTKYRLIDGGFGKYDDILSIEQEEMVLGTNTMTMEDILYFRTIHFFIQFLWNYKYYLELLSFLKAGHINPLDFIIFLINDIRCAPRSVRKIFEDFMNEAYNEWFDSKQELINYYSRKKNFEIISKGGFGKLNYKYTYRFLLECKSDFDNYLFTVARSMLVKKKKLDSSREQQLDDLLKYTSNIWIDFSNGFERFATEKKLQFKYDIYRWKKQGYRRPLFVYKNSGIKLKFIIPNEQIEALKKLYEQFKGVNINQTLRKMGECMKESDLFYKTVNT